MDYDKLLTTPLVPGISVARRPEGDDTPFIVIDPKDAYPEILKAIGAPEKLDQYWVECAYQCAKLEALRLIVGTEHDPRPDRALTIQIRSRKDKKGVDKWALSNFPDENGNGAQLADRGGARTAYRNWRGFLPA